MVNHFLSKSRPVDVWGSAKRSFYGHKMCPKWCNFRRVRPKVYMSSSVGRLCFHRKKAHRLCVIFGGGGGAGRVEIRPVAVRGLQKALVLATKWAQNGVILVGLGLGP